MLRRPIARVRERMVLGQVHPLLEGDERVAVWTHVTAPTDARPGLLSMTGDRCLVHWSPRDEATAAFRWGELTAWGVMMSPSGAELTMTAGDECVEVLLPLTTRARARNATDVVAHVARHAPAEATAAGGSRRFVAERRGWRGYARRVAVTVAGLLVVLLSIIFASPFVPGPGALTLLAGLAILAKEYDSARDVHHWAKRKFDRVLRWLRARRERFREHRAERRDVRTAGGRGGLRSGGAEVRRLADVRRPADPLLRPHTAAGAEIEEADAQAQ